MDEQLDDLNELVPVEAEPKKRGPGRPAGVKNKSASRTATRLRVRAFRERQREKAEVEMEEREESDRLFKRLRDNGFCMFGEVEPGVNAQTAEEELMLAREYAAALNIPDIRPGQTIRNFVTEVLRAYCSNGCRPYNRATRQFATVEIEGVKPDEYEFPEGADQPVQPLVVE